MKIANICTYPLREKTLPLVLESILPQVDHINICLNNYQVIPNILKNNSKISAIIPNKDYRDVGKFITHEFCKDDDIFYIDDDIIYPNDYVSRYLKIRKHFDALNPIIGLHGTIYPDVYNGDVRSRVVFSFTKSLAENRVVNQLGTGTIYCKGFQVPTLSFMEGSQKFVDVRFATHSLQHSWPMICVERENSWLREVETEETIFHTFTSQWPENVRKEVQKISGYSKLNINTIKEIKEIKEINTVKTHERYRQK